MARNGNGKHRRGRPTKSTNDRKVNVAVCLTPSVRDQIAILAANDGRSLSQYLGRLVEDHLARA